MRRKCAALGILVFFCIPVVAADISEPYEANVDGAADYAPVTGDKYTFWPSVYDQDDGNNSYADRIEVQSANGTLLGERQYNASPGEQFIPEVNATLPDWVTYIVIRGHDTTRDYGGTVLIIHFDEQAQENVDQGEHGWDFSYLLTGEGPPSASSEETSDTDNTSTSDSASGSRSGDATVSEQGPIPEPPEDPTLLNETEGPEDGFGLESIPLSDDGTKPLIPATAAALVLGVTALYLHRRR